MLSQRQEHYQIYDPSGYSTVLQHAFKSDLRLERASVQALVYSSINNVKICDLATASPPDEATRFACVPSHWPFVTHDHRTCLVSFIRVVSAKPSQVWPGATLNWSFSPRPPLSQPSRPCLRCVFFVRLSCSPRWPHALSLLDLCFDE